MMMPQELEVWYLLPALRREFTRIMLKKGLTQKQISKKLYLSKAAVSQYLKSKRAKKVKFDAKMQGEITKSVNKVLEHGSLIKEMQHLCIFARKERVLCNLSKSLGIAPKNCEECFR